MKRISFLVVMALASCAPAITVTTDYDRNASFASYKTFKYTDEALNLQLDDLNKRRLFDALDQGLAGEGLTKTDNDPDLLVDVKLTLQQRKEATANTSGGYGAGYPYRWGGGFTTTTINVETYLDGTLIIDFIDLNKKQLVWQGRGVKTLDTDATPEQKEQRIKEAVAAILAKYPPVVKK